VIGARDQCFLRGGPTVRQYYIEYRRYPSADGKPSKISSEGNVRERPIKLYQTDGRASETSQITREVDARLYDKLKFSIRARRSP
jgi:hypothetical protein